MGLTVATGSAKTRVPVLEQRAQARYPAHDVSKILGEEVPRKN